MTFTTRLLATTMTAALLAPPVFAQTSGHSGHDMNQMDHSKVNASDMNHEDMKHGDMNHGSMNHDAMMKGRTEHMIEATGVVKEIYKKDGLISLSHDAIPDVNWPAMTMKFSVGDEVDLDSLKKDQTVQFTLHRASDGSLPLVELCPTVSATVIPGLCTPAMNHGSQNQSMDHSMMKNDDMNHDGMKQ